MSSSVDNFYIELISNGSMDIFKDNTLASFSNFIPEQVNLEGVWEVGLAEVTYPAMFFNLHETTFQYTCTSTGWDEKRISKHKLTNGMYCSLNDVMSSMNNEVKESNPFFSKELSENENLDFFEDVEPIEWTFNEKTQKARYVFPALNCKVDIPKDSDLSRILGHPTLASEIERSASGTHLRQVYESEVPCDLVGLHSVFAYCNIVEHSLIGDVRAPILKIFPFIPRMRNEAICPMQFVYFKDFSPIQYRRVIKNSFHSITCELRTPQGKLCPFIGAGLTRLTLHFRKSFSS